GGGAAGCVVLARGGLATAAAGPADERDPVGVYVPVLLLVELRVGQVLVEARGVVVVDVERSPELLLQLGDALVGAGGRPVLLGDGVENRVRLVRVRPEEGAGGGGEAPGLPVRHLVVGELDRVEVTRHGDVVL